MISIDTQLIEFMSQDVEHTPDFINAVGTVGSMYLFKGVVLMSLLWWIWFRAERANGPDGEAVRRRHREIVVVAIISGFIALATGRLLAHHLPFRMRPMYEPALRAFFPQGLDDDSMPRSWSAFPSDHVMLWSAVATGIFFASRPLGIYALLHAIVLIGLPRIYLGLHYPTDVLGGAALGIGIACLMNMNAIRTRVAAPMLALAQRYPGVFYAAAFLFSFELTTQFDELRVLAHGLVY